MVAPPPPPAVHDLPAGYKLRAGMGWSTVLPDMDFETYSEAGFVWTGEGWTCLPNAPQGKKGLPVVGAAVYAKHPSCEVLSFYYDLKDGRGRRHWKPGDAPPLDLFAHLAKGGLIEAWNAPFEHWVWNHVCRQRYGWPELPQSRLRCAMAKARAHSLPGSLALASDVLQLQAQKNPDGARLLRKFSIPRNPTKKDPRRRILPANDPEDAARLYAYNAQDIVTEAEASSRCPDLEGFELEVWQTDARINYRGVAVDVKGVEDCAAIIDQAHSRYNSELAALTGGTVSQASEVKKLTGWLGAFGVHLAGLDEEAVAEALKLPKAPDVLLYHPESESALWGVMEEWEKKTDIDSLHCEVVSREELPPHVEIPPYPAGVLPAPARRALEIRAAIASAAVKKAYSLRNRLTAEGRVHDLFNYHAARTGRVTGDGPQPTNFPSGGPAVKRCECGAFSVSAFDACPSCGAPGWSLESEEWSHEAAEFALSVIASRSLDLVEYYFGDAMAAVSGCLRGLFVAAPGHDLLGSDYSAIEAVVLAELAGEAWRQEVFRTHGKIYEMSGAKVLGLTLEEVLEHKQRTGQHHPARKKGKINELALGYQGWIGALRAFGAPGEEPELKRDVIAWRDASPAIVEFWGGQERNWLPELFGVEGAFVKAILNPGRAFEVRGLGFTMQGDALYLRLLSGRYLTYHRPRLAPSTRRPGTYSISYEGYNTNPKNGPIGWLRMETWGGKLVENIVQATSRDIQWFGIVNLEKAGYPIVLHVYDEDVAEIPQGFGSVEEFERIMSTMPTWAAGWPVRAAGGWRGRRYRK